MTGTQSILNEIKTKSESLYSNGIIKKATRDFFLKKYNQLKEELETYKNESDIAHRESIFKLASEIDELYRVLDSIEKGQYELQNGPFFKELLNKYVDYEEIDLWVLVLPCRSPNCRFFGDEDGKEFFYLLQIPCDVDYLSRDLIGILAHEVAHVSPIVNGFVNSIHERRRKIGESIADIFAYSTVEYLFSYSCVYFVKNIITIEKIGILKPRHPSWANRLNVLSFYTDKIWVDSQIIQRNMDVLDTILCQLPDLNDLSISEWELYHSIAREWKNLQRELMKYKIDEEILINLENLDEVEMKRVGEIPKRIRELILDAHA